MICPHCNKEINITMVSMQTKEKVFNEICSGEHSIASLSRKLAIPRNTLRYYINLLLIDRRIVSERLEKRKGRPTILKPIEGKE